MAWKLRKDKLKAGVPEAESSTEAIASPVSAATETEHSPVFDLSGSAFQPDPVGLPEEEPEIPKFLGQDQPIALAPVSHHTTEPEAELIDLEPLPTHRVAAEPVAETSFLMEPLPEFNPVMVPSFDAEPDAIDVAPPVLSPETETMDPQLLANGHEEDIASYQNLTLEREAIASGLVMTETETGLPKVAPFILDTPATAPTPEQPRMRSVVIRIGKLSATHFLTKDVTTIGRPDSVVQNYPDIEIELDDGISRRHAEIRHDGIEYALTDIGSTNGTILNGEMLTPHQPVVLQPGDQIRLGERTELLFE